MRREERKKRKREEREERKDGEDLHEKQDERGEGGEKNNLLFGVYCLRISLKTADETLTSTVLDAKTPQQHP